MLNSFLKSLQHTSISGVESSWTALKFQIESSNQSPRFPPPQTQSPRLVIDWHNYGHTILELALGPRHPLVRLSKAVEASLAPTADAAFCVSKAMKDDLERDGGWVGLAGTGAFVTVLYDRPAERFRFGAKLCNASDEGTTFE